MICCMQRATDATPAPSPAEGSASPAGSSSISSSSNETARSGNGAGPPTGDVLIELHDVSKAFGKKAILQGTTLKIRRGEAVGIIGASVQVAGGCVSQLLGKKQGALGCMQSRPFKVQLRLHRPASAWVWDRKRAAIEHVHATMGRQAFRAANLRCL